MTKDAFIERVIALRDTLYRVSYSLLPNRYDQDDAVQETVKVALLKWETLRDDRAIKPWLTRILINECYSILRKRKREIPTDDVLVEVPMSGDREIIEALMLLEPRHRLPMTLSYIEGYTTREIGQIMRLPESTVKSRLKRARELLRNIMDEGGQAHEIS